MSDHLHYFDAGKRRCAVGLPFPLPTVLKEWRDLRSSMARACPEPFTREEWGYLLAYLDPSTLLRPFSQSFGELGTSRSGPVDSLVRPRGVVAVWLPNNVGLLGALIVILVSLTGNRLRCKAGSRGRNLPMAFVEFARTHLPPGLLRTYLKEDVAVESFDHDDPRNATMAAEAEVRVVFGSDEAIAGIEALAHPIDSIGFSFRDRQSQAWVEAALVDEALLEDLIRVFEVYGRAGCTSPRRVVVLNGCIGDCHRIRDGLLRLWPQIIDREPAMAMASANVAARQCAAVAGWDAMLAERNAAVLAVGGIHMPMLSNPMTLEVVSATPDEAVNRLPANIQTIGYAVEEPGGQQWLSMLASTSVKRFVPLCDMHFFGPTWDGWTFWRQMFEEIEIG